MAITALALFSAIAIAADAKPPLSVYFETQLPYYYEGDDLPVAMTVKNNSEATFDNAKGLNLLPGLQVEDARGTKLKMAEGAPIALTQPKSLEKSAFFGRILPINELFPALQKAGNYRLTWKGENAASNEIILHIVQKYDPKKDYRVRFETDFGNITVELNKDLAPRHVRNLVDLIHQGFYNGNQFHRIIPGVAIIGGSPTGDLAAGSGYNLDPEPSRAPIEAGTLIQARNRETGSMDSGSHIMITAVARQDLRGAVSVLGKVVEGMDTVKTLAQVPTMKTQGVPPGTPEKPVKPVLIKKVTLTEVTGKETKSAGGAGKN
jgi:peptidyl-prolyl cis-trans isomerase B (cyclophilin B)